MQELEFIFMLKFWNEIFLNFHRVNQLQQNKGLNLNYVQICMDPLADQLCTSPIEFERYEAPTKEMLPDVNYKAAQTRKHIRKKVPSDNDGDENRRKDIHRNIRDIFFSK